jgi:glutaredoxin/uncharacterized damage-inducible protein DinB
MAAQCIGDAVTETMSRQGQKVIEAYWLPGCSSCLRMKEFLEKSNLPFEAINLAEQPDRGAKLKAAGMFVPAVMVGDQAIAGLDLKAIATFLGIDYDPPEMLTPTELRRKYGLISAALCRLVVQLSPEQLLYKSPDRDRSLSELAGHIATIMRAFLNAYDSEAYDHTLEVPTVDLPSSEAIVEWALETEAMFDDWWERFGYDDPMDRVIETYWGHHTLHEVFERAVWHPAQHTRQLAHFMERLEIQPDGALGPEDLEGLPIPDRIQA